MSFEIVRSQNFNLEFFEFYSGILKYRVGIAGFRHRENGCEMFFPESGFEYMLVVYETGWYKFKLSEFKSDVGIDYISEKLKCTESDARVIRKFVAQVLESEAAEMLLSGKENDLYVRNPFIV